MKIISLGLGVQSTAMYLMSSLGYIEKADYAIFADPRAEHPKTYIRICLKEQILLEKSLLLFQLFLNQRE